MRGAVRPRVLAVAAAAAAGLIALGAIASVAVWGFRDGSDNSATGVGGWLSIVWVAAAVAIGVVVVVALAGIRALRRPLEDLSRAANELQNERLPAALRQIEAGNEPAPRPGFSAPPELEGVAGALENLERFVHYHAKRAQRADRDLGKLLSGAADRAGARARLAEGIDFGPPPAEMVEMAAGLHRDADALRALVPEPDATDTIETDAEREIQLGDGTSIVDSVGAAARTTMRPSAVAIGGLEPALVDADVCGAVMVVLGEVIDAAMGPDGTVVVHGSVQPEGYHFVVDTAIDDRGAELAHLADALRDRDPGHLPFGLRAAVQAGKKARLLVWLTVAEVRAQWHVLVPPDSFVPAATTTAASAVPETAAPVERRRVVFPDAIIEAVHDDSARAVPARSSARWRKVGPETEPVPAPVLTAEPPSETRDPQADLARLATARRLGEALADLLARLETALESHADDGPQVSDEERTALLVDGTHLVARLQAADLCSAKAQRALLRAIDDAVAPAGSVPLAGSARDQVAVPYEALAEIRERIAGPLSGAGSGG